MLREGLDRRGKPDTAACWTLSDADGRSGRGTAPIVLAGQPAFGFWDVAASRTQRNDGDDGLIKAETWTGCEASKSEAFIRIAGRAGGEAIRRLRVPR